MANVVDSQVNGGRKVACGATRVRAMAVSGGVGKCYGNGVTVN